MERKIGEVFIRNGVKLQVENSIFYCYGCYLNHECYKGCGLVSTNEGICRKDGREDKTSVIFKEVK